MTTRQSNTEPLLPRLDDPEAIIKKRNAEQRRRDRIAAQLTETAIHIPLPSSPPPVVTAPAKASTSDVQIEELPFTLTTRVEANTLNSPPTPFLGYREQGPSASPTESMASSRSKNESKETEGGNSDSMSTSDCIRALMAMQQTTLLQLQANQAQAQADREASAARISRLEEIAVNTAVKPESTPPPSRPSDGRIDLQRFKISDGPVYRGPFRAVEPFLRWIHSLQIFFTSKAVEHADDKIRILGGLIAETNLLSFYANEAAKYAGRPWSEFKNRLLTFALPPDWRTDIKKNIRQLKMQESENFLEFSTRARTLQSMLNFDDEDAFGEFELAEYVTFGLSDELQGKVSDFRLLRTKPFDYSDFEERVAGFFEHLPKRSNGRPRPTTGPFQDQHTSPQSNSLWRLQSYLDSLGRCHFCKKNCGSENGACPGQIDKSYVEIPSSFKTPTKPADYKPPKATNSQNTTAGKPTHPPAGRPLQRAATVAGVEEINYFPELSTAAVSAIAALDEHLLELEASDSVDNHPAQVDAITLEDLGPEELEALAAIDEELQLAKDERYVSTPPPLRLAFHHLHISNKWCRRLATGLPIKSHARQVSNLSRRLQINCRPIVSPRWKNHLSYSKQTISTLPHQQVHTKNPFHPAFKSRTSSCLKPLTLFFSLVLLISFRTICFSFCSLLFFVGGETVKPPMYCGVHNVKYHRLHNLKSPLYALQLSFPSSVEITDPSLSELGEPSEFSCFFSLSLIRFPT
jgi:hypothetical protein